jgi:hypothetical protein
MVLLGLFNGNAVQITALKCGAVDFVIKNQFGERLANAYFLRKNETCFGE